MSQEDRRKYPRLNWSVVVHWEKSDDAGPQGGLNRVGASKDISEGGIRLILREGIAVGDVLELSIELGGGKTIRGKGRVMWVEKFEIQGGKDETGYEGGIEFLGMDEAARNDISRFVMESRKDKPK